MSEIHDRGDSTDDFEITPDRETLGTFWLRHPWAVRFVLFEAFVLALAGVIPFLGSSTFHYVLFGMVLSLGVLAAASACVIGGWLAARRLRNAYQYGQLDPSIDAV